MSGSLYAGSPAYPAACCVGFSPIPLGSAFKDNRFRSGKVVLATELCNALVRMDRSRNFLDGHGGAADRDDASTAAAATAGRVPQHGYLDGRQDALSLTRLLEPRPRAPLPIGANAH